MRVKVNHSVGRELYGLPRLGFLEPLDVRLEELLDELGLGVHVVDGLRLLLVKISEKARLVSAADQFPASLAHGPAVSPCPVQRPMG